MALSHLGYWVWDRRSGKMLACSDEVAAIFGVSSDAFQRSYNTANKVAKRLIPEDRTKSLEAHRGHSPLNTPVTFRFRLKDEDGTQRHIWEAGKSYPGVDGNGDYYLATLQDITDSRKRESELLQANIEVEKQADALTALAQELDDARRDAEQARERFELAVAASADGVWDWDLDTGTSEYSASAVRILRGTTDQSKVGQSQWPDYLHPEDREKAVTALADHLAGRTPIFECEHRVRHINGGYHWVRAKGKAVRGPDGAATRVIGTVHALDKEKRAEEALKDSERRYRTLVDGSIQGILIHRNYAPLFANEAYARMLGFESVRKFMATGSLLKHVPKSAHGRLREGWIKTLAGNMDGVLMRGPVIKRDGTEIVVESIGTLIEWDGEPAFQMTSMDVTQVRATELALADKNQQLERLIREKDIFMSILAHDLRSPFTGLLGFSDFLVQHANSLTREKVQDYARAIHSSGQNIYALLDNLLSWAKLQLDHLDYNPEELVMRDVANAVIEELSGMAEAKQIKLVNLLKSQKSLAEPTMITVLLRNLVTNAIKFSHADGRVEIAAERGNKGFQVFRVTDNGRGMAKAKLAQLFDPSQLTSERGTAGESGTGLGLMLCKEIVERHGGHMEVESTYRKGSTFRFSLPVNSDRRADQKTTAAQK